MPLVAYDGTWGSFQLKVREFLPVDDKRCGVQTYIDALTRSAVTNLMHHVKCYKINKEALYQEEHIQQEGTASLGKLPFGGDAQPYEAFVIFKDCRVAAQCGCQCSSVPPQQTTNVRGGCQWATVDKVRWHKRLELSCLDCSKGGMPNKPKLALSPDTQFFYLYPQLKQDEVSLLLLWQKDLPDWEDDEKCTLNEQAALAVSYFIKNHLGIDMIEQGQVVNFDQKWRQERTRLIKACQRRTDFGNYQND